MYTYRCTCINANSHKKINKGVLCLQVLNKQIIGIKSTCPRQSSGQDSALSPRRPGFDSPSGKIFDTCISEYFVNDNHEKNIYIGNITRIVFKNVSFSLNCANDFKNSYIMFKSKTSLPGIRTSRSVLHIVIIDSNRRTSINVSSVVQW